MKLENNWRNKTIESLEKNKWPDKIEYDSYLVKTTTGLRKKPLNAFTTEDLRIMIGQTFCLDYLITLALETLTEDLFAEGNFYEGDLLQSVLRIKTEFWDSNKQHWLNLHKLIEVSKKEIEERKIDTADFYKSKNYADLK